MADGHVFVVGSGRSGTSLMWSILNDCPPVRLAPETHFLDQWLPRFWTGDDVGTVAKLIPAYREHMHFTRLGLPPTALAGATPREVFANLLDRYADGASIAGDKTPTHFRYLDRLFEWFPQARVVFMVRDPRAVVGSLHALDFPWAEGTSWTHLRLWRDAAEAALRWESDPRVELVRYEDLVADPGTVLGALVPAVTGKAFDPGWTAHRMHGHAVVGRAGSLRTVGALTSDRVESWRGRLSQSDAAVIAARSAPIMRRLGYAIEAPRPGLAARVAFLAGGVSDGGRRILRAGRRPGAAARRFRYRRS